MCVCVQKTRIGMTVNNFRKSASAVNEEVNVLAKALIKGWKKLLHGMYFVKVWPVHVITL
jgi:hypothetical protein